ncbi:MAG: hypothetical protein IKC65_05590, partial [Lentisphaeria bacterium]|nr:hypothetical protein [Lentisphaeria bacterium]
MVERKKNPSNSRRSLHPFTLIELLVITAQHCCHFISNVCTVASHPFTLIELLVNAACKTGVLYNRCGMLSLWGGALKTDKNGQKRTKTDIGAPQNTAG